MRISDEYFNQLNPSYQNVIRDLEEKLGKYFEDGDSYCNRKQIKVLLAFASRYLIPKEYLKQIVGFFEDAEDTSLISKMAGKAYYQFYFDKSLPHVDKYLKARKRTTDSLIFKNLNFIYIVEVDNWPLEYPSEPYSLKENDLSFPHSHLNQYFNLFESQSNRPLSREFIAIYQMNKSYYNKIRAVENDVEEWFKLLCKAADANNDQEIVTHNVEYRLGSNLLDVKLWKRYMEYLRERDPAEMLQVYSKYCRFFLDDAEMKERYKQEVEKYGPVYVPWKNLFDFETKKAGKDDNDDEAVDRKKSKLSLLGNLYGVKKSLKTQLSDDQKNEVRDPEIIKLCKKFFDNYHRQVFPFKGPLMTYIMKNANSLILKKLHHSCKYFFARNPFPICHRLAYVRGKTKFCEESLQIGNDDECLKVLQNACISTTFDATRICALKTSSIISKLYRCDAKHIFIECKLEFNELKFLIQSGNVVVFKWTRDMDRDERLHYVLKKLRETDNFVQPPPLEYDVNCDLEDIVQYLPKIEKLEISYVRVTSQTFAKLLHQNFTSKIYWLKLHEIQGEQFDNDDFLEFCIKNRARCFTLDLHFDQAFSNHSFVEELKEKLKNYQKSVKDTTIQI